VSFDGAVARLRTILAKAKAGDRAVADIRTIMDARDEVLARYQAVFASQNIQAITEEEFRQFLHFKNNKHWAALQRMGPSICADMDRLREGLAILLDEAKPIRDRLNKLVPGRGPAFVPRLSKAVLTPILLICHPDRYGVWNQVSEGSMKALDLWPEIERGMSFGERYERVNQVICAVAKSVGVDLWTLDALWWRYEHLLGDTDSDESEDVTIPDGDDDMEGFGVRFGLERHLQEFLRDNWDRTSIGRDWVIYEEDGDPEAGYEYPCGIGRIDILARHRSERRWLVIELKRNQSSDQTVGQALRYIGWVKQRMAEPEEQVEGLIIAHQAEEALHYALTSVQNVRLQLYEVEFRLRSVNDFTQIGE